MGLSEVITNSHVLREKQMKTSEFKDKSVSQEDTVLAELMSPSVEAKLIHCNYYISVSFTH